MNTAYSVLQKQSTKKIHLLHRNPTFVSLRPLSPHHLDTFIRSRCPDGHIQSPAHVRSFSKSLLYWPVNQNTNNIPFFQLTFASVTNSSFYCDYYVACVDIGRLCQYSHCCLSGTCTRVRSSLQRLS